MDGVLVGSAFSKLTLQYIYILPIIYIYIQTILLSTALFLINKGIGAHFVGHFSCPYHPCMVYFPTFGWFFYSKYKVVYVYTIHGSYGICNRTPKQQIPLKEAHQADRRIDEPQPWGLVESENWIIAIIAMCCFFLVFVVDGVQDAIQFKPIAEVKEIFFCTLLLWVHCFTHVCIFWLTTAIVCVLAAYVPKRRFHDLHFRSHQWASYIHNNQYTKVDQVVVFSTWRWRDGSWWIC